MLSRLAFGPAPGEVDRLVRSGVDAWLNEQLAASPTPPAVRPEYTPALGAPGELTEAFSKKMAPDGSEERVNNRRGMLRSLDFRRFIQTAEIAIVSQHLESPAQLREVLVAFWIDHFNVFAPKGATKLYGVDFVQRALRPNALGRFEDLLLATARHPAMLLYLDNASSVAERMPRRKRRGAKPQKMRGLNENYARELMELHSLGVNGGYTQNDVVDVARILTGWGVAADIDSGFAFRPRAHDQGEKTVLGQRFPAGGGEEEGKRLIALLAAHPSTAKHIARKLCIRLVADDPPAACVDAAARAFSESDGRIDATVRAIATHPAFLEPASRRKKLKSPLEYLTSSLRALGGKPDGTLALSKILGRLGQPLLRQAAPTGYPEVTAKLATGGRMLSRLQLATALAREKLPGVSLALDGAIPTSVPPGEIPRHLLGDVSPELERTVRVALEATADVSAQRALAIAITLGSPDFQAQ